MAPVEHLSYSSINLFNMCPRAWRFKYVDGEPTVPGVALAFGSAFHATIEGHIVDKVDDKEPRPLVEIWSGQWQRQVEERGHLVKWDGSTPEEMHNLGVHMFSAKEVEKVVLSMVAGQYGDGPAVELEVDFRVPGVPVPITGWIDMIEADGVPVDFKTSARAWSASQAQGELQPLFYLAALNQGGYRENPDLKFRYYIFTKTKKPKVQIWEPRYTTGNLFWLFALIQEVWGAIEAEVFPPRPVGWKCSPKYCDFWGMCRGSS